MSTLRYMPSAFNSAAGFDTFYDEYPDLAIDIVNKIRDNIRPNHMELGVLANAFSEKKDLKMYWESLEPHGIPIYSDSGGLQVITRGMNITTELKEKVYEAQAKWSHFGLCFDEIPMGTVENSSSSMLDNSGRFYIDSLFQLNGTATGKNIKHQIEVFKKLKTDTKILFIVQGKDFKTLREFAWFAFEEIKKVPDYEKYIGGLAIGNTTNTGGGALLDFLLRFQHEFEFLPKSWLNNLHVLGAGTVSKIFGYMTVPEEYFKGLVLSADSTTQTKAMQFGGFTGFCTDTNQKQKIDVGRDWNPKSQKAVQQIWEYHKPLIIKHKLSPVCIDTFKEEYTQYNTGLKRLRAEFDTQLDYNKRSMHSKFFWSTKMIQSHFDLLNALKVQSKIYRTSTDETKLTALKNIKGILGAKQYKVVKELLKITNYASYMEGNEQEIIKEHPYTIELNITNPDKIVKINGKTFITDTYNGKVLGRELHSQKAQSSSPHFPDTLRGRILSKLDGFKIDCIATPETGFNKTEILDKW